MLYLVKMESLDSATAGLPPPQMAQMIEQVVLPTMDMIVKLEAERKILAGGSPVGSRAGVMIIDAASHSELD